MLDPILFDEETVFMYIGYAAGLATILTFTIQILKIIETKKVTNLSSYMYIIYSLGLVCWFTYGVYIDNMIIVISNLITFLFTFVILLLIIYYDAEDKIERARRDAQTSAFNRMYFEQTVPVKIAEAKATQQSFSIFMLSITNYEDVKKVYGPKAADRLLKTVAKTLNNDLRENDLVARYDDTKFSIYLSNTEAKTANAVIGRLSKKISIQHVKANKIAEVVPNIKTSLATSKDGSDVASLIKVLEKRLTENTELAPKKKATTNKAAIKSPKDKKTATTSKSKVVDKPKAKTTKKTK